MKKNFNNRNENIISGQYKVAMSAQKVLVVTFFILTCFWLKGQGNWCGAKLSSDQTQWLRNFQQSRNKQPIPSNQEYLPVQVHIVGDDDGHGYYRLENLWSQICDLNAAFSSVGLQFYIKYPIKYINNSSLYDHDMFSNQSQVGPLLSSNTIPYTVNIFYASSLGQFGQGIVCGYYSPSSDCIVLDKGCGHIGDKTIIHEAGHFFSLPHTFYGWEYGVTPPISDQELVDGSNCTTVADGFCDTPPDYGSQSWNCPLSTTYLDPNGDTLNPDASLHMSYSYDQCRNRFTSEQETAMYNNWSQNRNIPSLNSLNTDSLGVPEIVYPYEGLNVPYNHVTFRWRSVPGAEYYHIAVTNLPNFSVTTNNYLIDDTSITVVSWPSNPAFTEGRTYKWKVKALSKAYSCDAYSQTSSFHADPFYFNAIEENMQTEWQIYPNPFKDQTQVYFEPNIKGAKLLTLYDILGNTIRKFETGDNSIIIKRDDLPAGAYIIEIRSESKTYKTKLIAE